MFGAIAGDIIKSVYEQNPIKTTEFPLFSRYSRITDNTVFTVFDVSCQGSVPEAITAFLESENFEDAIRKGVSLGGDSDTIACIAGGIAQAFYKEMASKIIANGRKRLPREFLDVIDAFNLSCGLLA